MSRELFSQEAEQSVLGALLLDNGAFDRVADKLAASDFYVGANRVLYKHLAEQIGAGKSADVVTLTAALEASGDLEPAGGMAYLQSLLMETPTARNIERYAQIVVDHRIERDLAAAAATMAELSTSSGPVAERLDQAQRLLADLSDTAALNDPIAVDDILPEWVAHLERAVERGGELSGLSTGLADVDEKLSGLQAGDLVLVAGRPSMGKTSLAMGFARAAALGGKSALVFSLEMSRHQLVQLSVAAAGRVSSSNLRSGKVSGDQWDAISAGVGRLHHRKLFIDDTAGLSVDQMRARARRVKRKHGLDLVVVDYIQLMSGNSRENRNVEVSEISRGLKLMARELGVPVVALSQLSRKCEERSDKRPLMSDLRESGALEQDADVIIFVYRDEVYNQDTQYRGMAELIIAKHRMGETGRVFTTWLPEYNTFENFRGAIPDAPEKRMATRRDAFVD